MQAVNTFKHIREHFSCIIIQMIYFDEQLVTLVKNPITATGRRLE